jgi:hypothetical protein
MKWYQDVAARGNTHAELVTVFEAVCHQMETWMHIPTSS